MLRIFFILIVLLGFKLQAQNNNKSIVEKYYKLNVIVFKGGATELDIENIFKIFTDDFIYIHEKYGGKYSREKLLKGYKNNLAKGVYKGDIQSFKIYNIIEGENAISVIRSYLDKNKKPVLEKQMTLFEFKNGKISKIKEYW